MKTRMIALLILVAVIVGSVAAPVFAANSDKDITPNLDRYKVARIETEVIESKPSNQISALASTGGKIITIKRVGYNSVGGALWAFYHRITWTWDATRILSVQRQSWAEVYAPGWVYRGLKTDTGYYLNSSTYYSFSQGHFSLGTNGIYIQHSYPWVDGRVYRGGAYSYTIG